MRCPECTNTLEKRQGTKIYGRWVPDYYCPHCDKLFSEAELIGEKKWKAKLREWKREEEEQEELLEKVLKKVYDKRTTRIPEVEEAVEVVIELGDCYGVLEKLKRASRYMVGGEEAFLRTAARRLKYEYMLWRVVAKDDVGKAPGEVIYNAGQKWDTPFRIISTKPEGEIQITPKTTVIARYIEL